MIVKEERIKAIIAERGDHPGLVHIFVRTAVHVIKAENVAMFLGQWINGESVSGRE